ncbi:MAG TPA: hypothetical protein VFK23_00825, partial [Nitrospirota bacterium]|nr:hypothetical protein [Nitrospirota bacterium]
KSDAAYRRTVLPDEAVSRACMEGRALLRASLRERILLLTSQHVSGMKRLVAKCIVMLIQKKEKCKRRSGLLSINANYDAMKDSYMSLLKTSIDRRDCFC